MKTIITVLIMLVGLTSFTLAQSKKEVGVGLVVSLPMGNFGDAANTGFGGTAAFELQLTPQITGVGRIGYISYGTESNYVSFSSIPLLFGAKYFFMPNSGLYGIGKIGFNFFSTSVETPSFNILGSSYGGGSASTTSTEFTFVIGAGYEIPLNKSFMLDFAGAFNVISNFTNIQLRAGIKTEI